MPTLCTQTHQSDTNLLAVFIAWLNLDLRLRPASTVAWIAMHRLGYSLAFPIYIWLITGLIFYLQLQIAATQTWNAIKALATLFFPFFSFAYHNGLSQYQMPRYLV